MPLYMHPSLFSHFFFFFFIDSLSFANPRPAPPSPPSTTTHTYSVHTHNTQTHTHTHSPPCLVVESLDRGTRNFIPRLHPRCNPPGPGLATHSGRLVHQLPQLVSCSTGYPPVTSPPLAHYSRPPSFIFLQRAPTYSFVLRIRWGHFHR